MKQKKKLQNSSELLSLYSQSLTKELQKKLSPLAFELHFQYRSPRIAHISGYVVFRTKWVLEFDEIVSQEKTEISKLKYRYHVMNTSKQLIFRYDNVAHFPKVATYPHHKHLKNTVTVSSNPDLLEVIEEIETQIIKYEK